MSKWSEVKNDYTDDNGVTHIDAFRTSDDNEEGKVIALVIKGQVYYKDFDAMTDKYAQEVIQEAIADQVGDPTKKYYFLEIGMRNGEYEYESKTTKALDADVDPEKAFDEYVRNFYPFSDEGTDDYDNGEYYFNAGEVCACINQFKEITFDEYLVLRKYIL